jgi:hypothetical protein
VKQATLWLAALLLFAACGDDTPDSNPAQGGSAGQSAAGAAGQNLGTAGQAGAAEPAGAAGQDTNAGAGGAAGKASEGGAGMGSASEAGAAGSGGGGDWSGKPGLGPLRDRVGRPATSHLWLEPFEDAGTRDAALNDYNAAATESDWKADFAAMIQQSLAYVDGVDGECGNQLASDADVGVGGKRYEFFANLFTDDKLYVDLNIASCDQYLAVEINSVGIQVAECGGRMPGEDVIDLLYSLFIVGQPSGVSDGVASTAGALGSEFPYLPASP